MKKTSLLCPLLLFLSVACQPLALDLEEGLNGEDGVSSLGQEGENELFQNSIVGWTQFTPQADTQIIYVSQSEGSDSTGVVYQFTQDLLTLGSDPFNPIGNIKPFKTLATAYSKLRDGKPDWMLLKRGDTWITSGNTFGGAFKKSGEAEGDQRILVGTYGPDSEDRPKILTDPTKTAVSSGNNSDEVHHVAFVGLHFEPYNRQLGQNPAGFNWLTPGSDHLFEDLKIKGYVTNAFSGGDKQKVTIRRSIIVDNYSNGGGHSQGIFAKDIDQLLIEENIIDHNGWHASLAGSEATTFNHNMYLSTTNTNVVVRHNISTRASATGLQARTAGYIIGNVLQQNPHGINFGLSNGVPLPHANGGIGLCADNVVITREQRPNIPGATGINIGNIGARQLTPIKNNLVIAESGPGTGIALSGTNNFGIHSLELIENTVFGLSIPLSILGTPGVHLTNIAISENELTQVTNEQWHYTVRFRDAEPSADTAFSSNTYSSSQPSHKWFRTPAQGEMSLPQWRTLALEPEAFALDPNNYSDTSRNLATYNTSLGGPASLADFLSKAREQRKGRWATALTAQEAAQWIRDGFGMTASQN